MISPSPEQEECIAYNGSCAITARPGSGKTFCLSRKIIASQKASLPYQGVIAISYTNKASEELEERCRRMGYANSYSFFGTIDRFCLSQIIFPFARHCFGDIPRLEVVDEPPDDREYMAELSKATDETSNQTVLLVKKALHEGVIPLNAIGIIALVILASTSQCKRYLKARYSRFFVDEYQDCGEIQHKIVLQLVELGITGSVVGDVDQAIFGFAGKSPDFLKSLIQDDRFKHFEITENRRCDKSIVAYSLRLLGIDSHQIPPQDDIRIFVPHIDGDEQSVSRAIADNLPKIMEKYSVEHFNQVAVLARSGKSLDRFAKYCGLPCRLYERTCLDDSYSIPKTMFKEILQLRFSKPLIWPFVDMQLGETASTRAKRAAYEDIRNLAETPAEQLASKIDEIKALAVRLSGTLPNDDDLTALEETLNDVHKLKNAYAPADESEVNCLTYHKAKGLEFDIVFCLDCYEYILPGYDPSQFQQDLCLFYVGVTRAKQACYIPQGTFRHNAKGECKKASRSSFLSLNGVNEMSHSPHWASISNEIFIP